jgi:hypothetical protein
MGTIQATRIKGTSRTDDPTGEKAIATREIFISGLEQNQLFGNLR